MVYERTNTRARVSSFSYWNEDSPDLVRIEGLFAIRMMLGANAFNARIAAACRQQGECSCERESPMG